MRTLSRGGVTLKYPDEIGFAFNPCLIVVTGSGVGSMELEMTGEDGTVVNDQRDAFSGGCYAEVREYVQSFFNPDGYGVVSYQSRERAKTGQRILFRVIAGGETFDFSVFYVWGAMKPGGQEVYNGPKVLGAWVGYPFTVGVFVSGADTVNFVRTSGSTSVSISGIGVWNIPLEVVNVGDLYYVTSGGSGIRQATFDDTFDLTFRLAPWDNGNSLRVRVMEDVEDGMYLRWIDRHGFYRYWLFEKGARRHSVGNEGQFLRNNIISEDMEYGYQGGLGRQMIMTREEIVPVCAPLVDGDTWDMLADMVSSPFVDMFTGYGSDGVPRWVSVQAQEGTITKDRVVLQDFEAGVKMPDVPIQRL